MARLYYYQNRVLRNPQQLNQEIDDEQDNREFQDRVETRPDKTEYKHQELPDDGDEKPQSNQNQDDSDDSYHCYILFSLQR